MTVYTRPRPVTPHLHSPDVGLSQAANDAAFAWLETEYPSSPWHLEAITYNLGAPVDLGNAGNRRGQQLIGAGMGVDQTVLNMADTTQPIIRLGAEHSQVRNLVLTYNFSTTAPATAVAMQASGPQTLMSRIENVWCLGVGTGLHTGPGLWFSNMVQNLRVADYSTYGIYVQNQSTGNLWENIYLNNADTTGGGDFTTWGRRPATHALYTNSGDENTFNQINVEYGNFTERPVYFLNAGAVTINGLHLEGIEWGAFNAIVSVFGEEALLDVNGAMVDYNYADGGANTTQALFETGPNAQLMATSVVARDNGAGSMYVCRQVQQPANTPTPARIFLDNFLDRGTDDLRFPSNPGHWTNGAADYIDLTPDPGNPGVNWASCNLSSFKRFNDQLMTLEDQQVAGNFYRITVENGVLTATAVV